MTRKILFFACVLAFVAVGVGVRLHLFAEADQAAATWFESQITQSRTIAALVITQAGSDIVVLAIVALIGISLRRRSPYWLKRLLITVCGGMISNEVLKFVFYRQRPQYAHPI